MYSYSRLKIGASNTFTFMRGRQHSKRKNIQHTIACCNSNYDNDNETEELFKLTLHLSHLLQFWFVFFSQYWMLSKAGEIRRDEACLDYSGNDVVLYPCHGSKGNQVYTILVRKKCTAIIHIQIYKMIKT